MMSVPQTVMAEDRTTRLVGKASVGALTLIAANAGIIFIYFVYDLAVYQLAIIYWWESLWIGVYSGLKLLTASIFGAPYENRWVEVSSRFAFVFSIVMIGVVSAFFIMIWSLVGLGIVHATATLSGVTVDELLVDDLQLFLLMSVVFFIGHGVSFVVNFLILGEFRRATGGKLLALPLKRCLALGFAVAAAFSAAFYTPGLANTGTFVVLLILIKLTWDYYLHRRERRSFETG